MRTRYRDGGNVLKLPDALWRSDFLAACRGERTRRTPVWLMRQAGRYMAEYRALRDAHSFLELCRTPSLAAEATLFARERLDVDAAIIFSDILIVLEALGLPLAFVAGDGPSLARPIASRADVEALRGGVQAADDLGYVYEAIAQTARGLPAGMPLIGFCGAPFTLASYAIEGGGSRHFARTKAFMYREPAAWAALMDALVAALTPYLARQVAAGASALQIFDSWVGNLTRADFREFVAPWLGRLVDSVPAGVPVIVFGTGTAHLIDLLAQTGADVIGVDATSDLCQSWRAAGGPQRIAAQGNLDPCLLLGPRDRLLRAADAVLAAAGDQPGHIFNLGHGVLKETDPEQAVALVRHVHERSPR